MSDVDVYLKTRPSTLPHELTARLTANQNKHIMSYHPDAHEALSLTMPLRNESYAYEGLHPIFQMNLPEGALREALERATAKHYGSDDLTMLTILGDSQIGRLVYSLKDQPIASSTESELQLDELLSHQDAQLFNQLLARYAQSSGVAGVQPKVLMEITSHLTLTTHLYIVKSWGNEYPHLGCNEYVCLNIAKLAGLKVPETYLSDNGRLLISKRFDIDESGTALGFEDFCVLQAKGTKEKYDSSIEQCANTIRHFVSSEHQAEDLADLFKLTVLNVRLRNGDAHLKNLGIQYSGLQGYSENQIPETVRKLAPIYDLVSTVPYLPKDTMALTLTGSKRWPKRKVLHDFGRQHCQLSQRHIDQIEAQIDEAVKEGLPLLEKLQQQHDGFVEVGDVMRQFLLASGNS